MPSLAVIAISRSLSMRARPFARLPNTLTSSTQRSAFAQARISATCSSLIPYRRCIGFTFNHHVAPTSEVPVDPLRRVSSSGFRQRSPKGCTSSSRLSVRRNCRSRSEAACTDCSMRSCQSSSCLGSSFGRRCDERLGAIFCASVSEKAQASGAKQFMVFRRGREIGGLNDASLFHHCNCRHYGGSRPWRVLLASPASGADATSEISEYSISPFRCTQPRHPAGASFLEIS